MFKYVCYLLILCFVVTSSAAQSPTDGEMMSSKQLCLAGIMTSDSWSSYWESTTRITNGNIGTLKRQTLTFMGSYGLTSRVNLLFGLPHVTTTSTAGTIHGNSGIQDGSLALKAKMIQAGSENLRINVFGVLGGSMPLAHYNNDSGPYNLGNGAPEAYVRLMPEIVHSSGVYLRPHASYHMRGVADLERSFYYTSNANYGEQIDIPNMSMIGSSLGGRFFDNALRIEATYTQFNSIGGSEIRRYDMPLADANMDGSLASGFIQWHPTFHPALSIMGSYGQVLTGRNIGKSTFFSGGLTYILDFSHKSEN